jgi:hypothetical protein
VRPTALLPVAVAAVLAAPPLVLAYREGPLPAMTGGFGEETCAKCHFDHALNDPGGSLKIDGVPERVEPGREYAITIAVTHAAAKRAGFELSARRADGPDAGTQAGTFRAADARTQIVTAPGGTIQYIQHTKLGSDLARPNQGRWTFYWTAPPASSGGIIFHAAANAANDDESALGDFIYTASRLAHSPGLRPSR